MAGEKAASPMVAVVGTVTRAREVQPKKAKLLMEARPAGLQVVRTKAAQPRKAALLADGGEAVGQRDGGEGRAAAEDRHWAKRLAGRVREVREEPLRRPGPAKPCLMFGRPCAPIGLSHDGLPPTSKPSGRGARPPRLLFRGRGVVESEGGSAADTHGRRWHARCMWR